MRHHIGSDPASWAGSFCGCERCDQDPTDWTLCPLCLDAIWLKETRTHLMARPLADHLDEWTGESLGPLDLVCQRCYWHQVNAVMPLWEPEPTADDILSAAAQHYQTQIKDPTTRPEWSGGSGPAQASYTLKKRTIEISRETRASILRRRKWASQFENMQDEFNHYDERPTSDYIIDVTLTWDQLGRILAANGAKQLTMFDE